MQQHPHGSEVLMTCGVEPPESQWTRLGVHYDQAIHRKTLEGVLRSLTGSSRISRDMSRAELEPCSLFIFVSFIKLK